MGKTIKIEFSASFGLETKFVEICPINGTGGSFHLYVDRWYYGCFTRTEFGFVVHLPPKNSLTSDDIQIVEAMILDALKE